MISYRREWARASERHESLALRQFADHMPRPRKGLLRPCAKVGIGSLAGDLLLEKMTLQTKR